MLHRKLGATLIVAALATGFAQPARAQDITTTLIDSFLKGYAAESTELQKIDAQLQEIDEKIRKWTECKTAFEAAGEATGKKLGGLAAGIAIKAKCGASNDEGFRKDKAKILAGPEKAAATASGMKQDAYAKLKEKLIAYVGGDRNFKAGELEALNAKKADLGVLGRFANVDAGGGGGMKGAGMAAMGGAWTMDYAWAYIGQMFALQYMSGATMVEKPYQPGEWTKWELKMNKETDKTTLERAFLAKTPEGNEWWRMRYDITSDGKTETVLLEAMFKPVSENVNQLVRIRGKLPGSTEGQELMVPQHLTMLSMNLFPMKPTKESLDGATVGTETVAGVSAKRVRFGAPNGGSLEWWIADSLPGGWAKFQATAQDKNDGWTMELVGHGKGAKSELGVIK